LEVLTSPLDGKLVERARRELVDALGEEKVTTKKAILFGYSGTALPIPKTMPDIVVRPLSVEDVQVVLRIADKLIVPVTPISSGTLEPSVIPKAGGIVLDMYGMDQILEINTDAAYAVIEPGVGAGKFVRAIRPHGFRATLGSYPPGNSLLGNYHLKGHGSHRASGIDSEVLGLEVVIPDGTIVRTGSKAFEDSYPGQGWHAQWGPLPDLRGIFMNACGTLGVITKMAARIYPLNDVQALPVMGFDSYGDAVEFMKIASRANLVEHCVTWHWGLYTVMNLLASGGEAQASDDYLKVLMTEPWQHPEDRPYCMVLNIMTGFEEDIDTHAKLLEKIAKGLGGRRMNEEIQERWPGTWDYYKTHGIDHEPCTHFMKGFGLGYGFMHILYAEPKKVVELERFGLEYIWSRGLQYGTTYYSHCIDQGRSIFLRLTPFVDPVDEQEHEKAVEIYRGYIEEGMKRYGATAIRYDGIHNYVDKSGGFGELLKRIKKAVDPNNILNPGLKMYEGGW
jgi:FAD/FMN-containing dehydrogenase